MSNRRLLIYGATCVAFLTVAISVFFVKLFRDDDGESAGMEFCKNPILCKAIPSDAVLVIDAKELGSAMGFIVDTASAICDIVKGDEALFSLQKRMAGVPGGEEFPMVISLHYSSKNEVSFFCALDISSADNDGDLESLFPFLSSRKKRYNNTDIYIFNDSIAVAGYGNIVIMSSSLYVLESSIRHLDNGISIYDNPEFKKLYGSNGTKKCLYVNHGQIGKLFSGVMEREFLKYSDFFMRLASWSAFPISASQGIISLNGIMENGGDEKYHSWVLYGQSPAKSGMGDVLPSETIFAFSMVLSDMKEFKKSHNRFLDVHKKLSGYRYKQHLVDIEGAISSEMYTDSLEIEEIVAAYCKFGDRYEWIHLVKERGSFGISDVVSSVISKNEEITVMPYLYKGYLGAVFGEAFTHCNEEVYCKMDGWNIIGPKEAVSEYAVGNATYFNLDQYMDQTPLSGFFEKKGSVKVLVNLQMGKDSVGRVVKPYYRGALARNMKRNNFNFITVNVGKGESGIVGNINYCAVEMERLPQPAHKDETVKQAFVDSTIVIDEGPFELVDFVNGGKCYLEQTRDFKLRLLNGKRKSVWTIPFGTPLCGSVVQVDFFKNNKLQMLFVSGNKLYLLDRLGRMVKGFPVELEDKVVYGPVVIDPADDKNYSFMVLNADNSVSLYKLSRYKIESCIKIQTPEYVKELPELRKINGKNYLFLKTVNRIRIYTLTGKELLIKDKKRIISPESEIVELCGNEIRVKNPDGKAFILDLLTGKTRKE